MPIEKNLKHKLNAAIDTVIASSIKNNEVVLTQGGLCVGAYEIVKTINNGYNVRNVKTSKVYYSELSFFDAAYVLAKRLALKTTRDIKEIVGLEQEYSWHKFNIDNYRNCYKTCKSTGNTERSFVLEDKMQYSHTMLCVIRQKMKLFKNIQ